MTIGLFIAALVLALVLAAVLLRRGSRAATRIAPGAPTYDVAQAPGVPDGDDVTGVPDGDDVPGVPDGDDVPGVPDGDDVPGVPDGDDAPEGDPTPGAPLAGDGGAPEPAEATRPKAKLPRAVDGSGVTTFRGGLRWPLPGRLGTTTTSRSLVDLELHDWGIQIRARSRLVRWYSPEWSATYDELWAAEMVCRGGRRRRSRPVGIRFRGDLVGAPMIFLSYRAPQIADDLAEHGVVVVRELSKMALWSNA